MNEKVYFLVVYDDGYNYGLDYHGGVKNDLLSFIQNENFKCTKGFWGCPWYFIDIENKIYYPGRPGMSYGKVIGDHAITFDEFKTIYNIYKKYNGLLSLVMEDGKDYRYSKRM